MYNPRGWPSEHRIALAVATAVGAGVGLALGYALTGGDHSFDYWAWNMPWRHNGYWSAGIGAGVGAAAVYIAKLLR